MEEKISRGKIKTVATLLIEELQKPKLNSQHKAKTILAKLSNDFIQYQDPDVFY